MSYALVAGAVISAGTAAYSANQQKKASKEAQSGMAALAKKGQLDDPELADWQNAGKYATQSNLQNWGRTKQLASGVNAFQQNQALRGYEKFQPYFRQNQELVGRNAASFARGELPSDVVGSIGRAAAQRGIQGGFGMSQGAGGGGTALGSLNLRNLGLASLDLSKWGTQFAQETNKAGASMMPGLFDPSSQFLNPALAMNGMQFNANAINQTNQLNAGYENAMGMGMIANQQQSALQQGQMVQGASNTVVGLMGQYAQMQQAQKMQDNYNNRYSSPDLRQYDINTREQITT
jgi:hypothetical protein